MHSRFLIGAAGAAVLLCTGTAALAQAPTWNKEQTEVWSVVSKSWDDEVAQNGKWPNDYVDERVVSWGDDWPAPRYRASLESWTRFADKQGKTLKFDLSPLAITVSGDTAVAHYSVVMVTQKGTEKTEREVSGNVETLVRTGGKWRFLSLAGFGLSPGK
ncbi:MAG: nuclear transport factor 2 family protein [Pseudomonadota bacterium]